MKRSIGSSNSKNSNNLKNEAVHNVEFLPNPIKSASDKKEYKVLKLENGLVACLVSDNSPLDESDCSDEEESGEDEEMESENSESEGVHSNSESESDDGIKKSDVEQKLAAAGLCISVGSFYDPPDVPGMAHFLEHMVFMGSEKFPDENDFDAFIQKSGGSDNASTDTETTCFYFDCLEKHLFNALDKFSQFFVSPLMKKEAMTREREAIESEFQMALPSDSSRKEQLMCSFAKKNSPVNSFAWGNLITLRDNTSDDKLYDGVHEFRKRHYSAHRMTLAIQARLPIETLQDYVIKCFSNVPNNKLAPPDLKPLAQDIFNTSAFKRIYYVKPTKDICEINLTWAMPPLQEHYKSKPHQYLSILLGDEGKGSLLSYLKNKVWGLANSTGNGETGIEYNSLYALFTVTIVLTEDGLKNLNEVIEAVFSYINMLKKLGPQKRIFDEIKQISDTSFQFSTEESASDFVEELSEAMQTYPPEHYISGSELFYNYDPEAIDMVLKELTPDKLNIIVLSKNIENITFDKKEKWFGTEYTDKEISQELINKWANVQPYPEFNIPEPNPYITNDFCIIPEIQNIPDYPTKILNTPLVEVWYRRDQKFKLPKAYYYFYLINPIVPDSPANACKLDMLMNLLQIYMTEDLYPAMSAELYYKFTSSEKGLMLKIGGFNEKLPVLIEVISKHLRNIGNVIQPDIFDAVKTKLINNYYNRLIKPSNLAKSIRLSLLMKNDFLPTEKYTSLLDVTFEQMRSFCDEFFKSLYVKCLVQGNVEEPKVKETIEQFVSKLNYKKIPENSYPVFTVGQIPLGERCCRIENLNKNDSNSIVTNYYQSGPFTVRTSIIIELILLIIEEPLFDTLRTKEQLGYHVFASVRDTFGILGFSVTVNAQATKNSTQHVDNRMEEFMKHAKELLAKTTKRELEDFKSTLIKMKQTADVHLKEEMDRNWEEITSDDYQFDRLKQEIETIPLIKLKEIRKWWDDHNGFGNKSNFRKLSIQIVGHNINDNKDTEKREVKTEQDKGQGDTHKPVTLKFLNKIGDLKKEKRLNNYFINDVNQFKDNITFYPPQSKNFNQENK